MNLPDDMYVYMITSLMCNMRHKFCYQKSFSNERLSDEILYEKLKPLYPHIKLMRLHGGEITVIPGMKEYIYFLGQSYPKMKINIVTNGMQFDNEWIELSRKYNLLINFSLNASDETSTQKIIHSGNGKYIWDKIYGNLQKLVVIHENNPVPLINAITMVVYEDTVDQIIPFTQLALNHGLNIMFQFPCSDCINLSQSYIKSIFTVLKMKYFCKEYISIKLINLPIHKLVLDILDSIDNGYFDEEKAQFLNSIEILKKTKCKDIITYESNNLDINNIKCKMPWSGLTIMPSGNILPCSNLSNYILGNIYDESLENILSNKYIQELRNLVANNDYKYCWKNCNCNFNPDSSIPGISIDYVPPYKKLFNQGDYKGVLNNFKTNNYTNIREPEDYYIYAYSLHMEGHSEEAIKNYAIALEKGFSEFWVRYNRGCLYFTLGDYRNSYIDIKRACELDGSHEGVKLMMQELENKNIES